MMSAREKGLVDFWITIGCTLRLCSLSKLELSYHFLEYCKLYRLRIKYHFVIIMEHINKSFLRLQVDYRYKGLHLLVK